MPLQDSNLSNANAAYDLNAVAAQLAACEHIAVVVAIMSHLSSD